jgi:ligand-binding sensor domain-containing protein
MSRRRAGLLAAFIVAGGAGLLVHYARATTRAPVFDAVFTSTRKVTAVAVTAEGAWLGTEGGLVHWDEAGTETARMNTLTGLPANRVSALLPLEPGTDGVLVGTDRGGFVVGGPAEPPLVGRCTALCRYEGEVCAAVARQVMCLREAGWEPLGPPLPADARCVAEHDGELWAGTGRGLFLLSDDEWEPVVYRDDPLAATVNAIAASEAMYVGTVGGLFVWEDSEWRSYTTADGLPDNHVTALAPGDEAVYIATYGGGVARLSGRQIAPLTGSPAYATALAWDARGSALWVGTEDQGAFRWDGLAWQRQPEANEPAGHNVTSLAAGPGELLVGTFEHGVTTCREGTWQSAGSGLSSTWINHVAYGQGRAWARTSAGDLFVRDGDAWHAVTKASGLTKPWTSFVGSAGGNVWVGTWGAISKFDGRRWQSYAPKPALADQVVTGVAVLGRDIWVGTAKSGLLRYNGHGGNWETYTLGKGLTDTWITGLAAWHGSLWVGTFSGGLCRFDGHGWEHLGAPAPLPSDRVNCLAATDCLYVGTLEGLCRFDGTRWTTYGRADGLPSEIVQALCVDGDRLWVGTPEGLACGRLVEVKPDAVPVGRQAPPPDPAAPRPCVCRTAEPGCG